MNSIYMSDTTMNLFNDYKLTFKSEQSRKNYFTVVNQFCDYERKDFVACGMTEFMDFCNHIDAEQKIGHYTYKTACFKYHVLLLFSYYIDAHGKDYGVTTFRNSMMKIPKPVPDSYVAVQDIPSTKELDMIYNTAKLEPMMHAVIALVNKCALTSQQITKLRKSNFLIDANQNVGLVLQFEYSSNRYIKVPDDVVKIMNTWMAVREAKYGDSSPFVFVNANGEQISMRSLQNRVKKIMTVTFGEGGKTFTIQDLRNLSAVLMIKGGAEKDTVADYLGIKARWIQRYSKAVEQYSEAPCDYINLTLN